MTVREELERRIEMWSEMEGDQPQHSILIDIARDLLDKMTTSVLEMEVGE